METTISVSSVFNAPAERIWALLVQIDTLRIITRPFAYFTPLDDMSNWEQDAQYRLNLKVFGILSFGVHYIYVVKLNKASWELETHECNDTVKVWNHTIRLEAMPDGKTKYTDTVTLYAGKLTLFVKLWSMMFYRHRQRKWRRIL